MANQLKIERLDSVEAHIDELSDLLIQVVDDGASIGFLPPLSNSEAANYWKEVVQPDVYLFVAKLNNHIAGSIQLHLSTKQNGRHRAEIAKLMTHPDFRREGIGRLLMKTAEEVAMKEGRTLLVLDTREGDLSNLLYNSMGYMEAGKIPHFAKSANGELHSTIFYYKILSD